MIYVCVMIQPNFISGGKQCTTEPVNITDAVREALAKALEAEKRTASSKSAKVEPQKETTTKETVVEKPVDDKEPIAETSSEKSDEAKDKQQRDKI